MSQDHIKQDVASRERRINLKSMPPEQVDSISKAIGEKIGAEMNAMVERCKKMLQVYGLEIKVSYILHAAGDNPLEVLAKEQEALKQKKPATRKPRAKKDKAG